MNNKKTAKILLQSVLSKRFHKYQQHYLRKELGCIMILLLCITLPFTPVLSTPCTGLYAHSSVTERKPTDMISELELESGSFLTYELKLVLVRFTNGSMLYSGSDIGSMYLNISFEAVTSDEFLLNLNYSGSMLNSSSGIVYAIVTSFRLQYSTVNRVARILNGTLKDTEGILSLFEQDFWIENDNFTISTAGNATVFARYMASDRDVGIRVMGDLQIVNDYNCTFFNPSTNSTSSHLRSYDRDRGVLVEAPHRFADPILLGGINMLSTEGSLSLVNTNIDLGPPVTGVALTPPLVLAVGGVVVFVLSYSLVYMAQTRKKDSRKRRRKNG